MDLLGGQAKTLMFIHVSPDPDTVGETVSTLKFAERVSTVELGAAKSNKDIIDLKDLKDQVAALKAALGKEGADISNVEVCIMQLQLNLYVSLDNAQIMVLQYGHRINYNLSNLNLSFALYFPR